MKQDGEQREAVGLGRLAVGREAFEQKLKGQGGQEQSREAGPLHTLS